MIRTFLYALTVQLISPAGAEPEFVNLATKARITASSELEGQGLMAGAVADLKDEPSVLENPVLLRIFESID